MEKKDNLQVKLEDKLTKQMSVKASWIYLQKQEQKGVCVKAEDFEKDKEIEKLKKKKEGLQKEFDQLEDRASQSITRE